MVGNGAAGAYALLAWRVTRLRGRPVWVATVAAEAALAVQVVLGVLLARDEALAAPRFHDFYGFAALLAVGLAYGYRTSMRGRLEMFYGLVGLFLMGMAIRAFTLT